jgi:DnaJ-class molecular chaperone
VTKNKTDVYVFYSGHGLPAPDGKSLYFLPHGVDEGQFYRLEGKGDFSKGMYGDLILRIKIAPQDNFEKLNNDLVYNAYLGFDDLQKDSLEIPHPSGTVSVKLPKEFDSSKPLRVKGKGFSTNGVGDMFIKLIVKFNRI